MMDKTERNAVWHESVERFGTRLQLSLIHI